MLNDSAFAPGRSTFPGTPGSMAAACRRSSDRIPYPAELILIWHHDPATRIRYRIVDAGDGGFRIRTNLPLVEGMTGMALKMLPEGRPVNRPVMVAWVSQVNDWATDDGDAPSGREAGLRFF